MLTKTRMRTASAASRGPWRHLRHAPITLATAAVAGGGASAGRGLTKARTTIADYVIVVTLRDCLTTAQSNLLTARGNVALF